MLSRFLLFYQAHLKAFSLFFSHTAQLPAALRISQGPSGSSDGRNAHTLICFSGLSSRTRHLLRLGLDCSTERAPVFLNRFLVDSMRSLPAPWGFRGVRQRPFSINLEAVVVEMVVLLVAASAPTTQDETWRADDKRSFVAKRK